MTIYIKSQLYRDIESKDISTDNLGEYLYDHFDKLRKNHNTDFVIKVLDRNTYLVEYYALSRVDAIISTNKKFVEHYIFH